MVMKLLTRLSAAVFVLLLMCPLPAQDAQAPKYEDIFGHPLPPQHIVYVFGQRIAYYDMGQSKSGEPALVLLHGFGSQADVDFGAALPSLSRTRRVIALDQIGSGNSAKPLIEYRVQTYVEFLGEFLRTLGIARFDLAGESLGGWTASQYVIQALAAGSTMPKPGRRILEDTGGYFAAVPLTPKLSVSTVDEVVTGLRAVFYDPAQITPEVARRRLISKLASNDGLAARTFAASTVVPSEVISYALARTIRIPTLVVWGAEDRLIPVEKARAIAAAIPGAQLRLIEHCGHVPSLEQPEAFARIAQEFLAGREITSVAVL